MINYLLFFELHLAENEIFYRAAGCFWAQQYYLLEEKIAETSILSLTQKVLNEKEIPFKIKENRLWSEIYIKKSDSQIYRLNIFHKAFNSNPELLLKQLSDLHEEYIKDEIECIKIDSYNFNDPESITISLSK